MNILLEDNITIHNILENICEKLKNSAILDHQIYDIYNSFAHYLNKTKDFTHDHLHNLFINWVSHFNNFSNTYKIIEFLLKNEDNIRERWLFPHGDIFKIALGDLIKERNIISGNLNHVAFLTFVIELRKLMPDLNNESYNNLVYIQKYLRSIEEYNNIIIQLYNKAIPDNFNNKVHILKFNRPLFAELKLNLNLDFLE